MEELRKRLNEIIVDNEEIIRDMKGREQRADSQWFKNDTINARGIATGDMELCRILLALVDEVEKLRPVAQMESKRADKYEELEVEDDEDILSRFRSR